jgi:hypothetical protein
MPERRKIMQRFAALASLGYQPGLMKPSNTLAHVLDAGPARRRDLRQRKGLARLFEQARI